MTQLRRMLWFAVFGAVTLVVMRPGAVLSQGGGTTVITPGPAVPVTSPRITVNNDNNDHNDPHVNGDLAAYTEINASQNIRYYRFSTGVDQAIPTVAGASDALSDVNGNRIVFSRALNGCDSIFLFDVTTASESEVAPAPCPQRLPPRTSSNNGFWVVMQASPLWSRLHVQ